LAIAASAVLLMWLSHDPAAGLALRLPGADNSPEQADDANSPTQIKGTFTQGTGIASPLPDSWPAFRGAGRDAISPEQTPLSRQWPPDGPPVLWSIEVGEGYAGAAVLSGRVYLIDYDRAISADAIRCLSLDNGDEIWRYSYPVKVKRNHGMSRTVPAVTDKYVVTIGPKCHVTCLDSQTGGFLWMLDLERQFGTTTPPWYAGQCPLIDGDKVILAPAGQALMIAVNLDSGQVVWESPNPKRWKMTHASIMPMEFAGKKMYVYCGSSGVAGVSAEDGTILWDTKDWKIRIATVPSPLVIDKDRIFLSGGYNAGSMMLQLVEEAGGIKAAPQFKLAPEIFGSPQHTPIFYNGYVYGVRPDGRLVCLDTEGKVIWNSEGANKFGLGPYIIADGLIYLLDDHGTLTLAEASAAEYKQLAQAKIMDGTDCWGPMALASGRLILRDLTKMICLDVAAK
jgi:outer membrane protein assembly factor BamB